MTFEGVAFSGALPKTDRGAALRDTLETRGVSMEPVSESDLKDAADTDTPQGILAVIQHPQWTISDIGDLDDATVLVLDGIQDPGNVGALIRTAHALRASAVLLLTGCAVVTHPKVLRAAMGSTFIFPTISLSIEAFREWHASSEAVLWAAAAGGENVGNVDSPNRLALAVGNEGSGLRAEISELAERTVGVPLALRAESLNVAVAAGILLHEVIHNA